LAAVAEPGISKRRRVVKFVCDVPTTIDQRLFAIGRTIQQDME
jgi:hypothetical protein